MCADPIFNMAKIATAPDETDHQFIRADQFLL